MAEEKLESEEVEKLFRDVVDGAGITFFSLSLRRIFLTVFAYVINFFAGPAVYGVLTVFERMTNFVRFMFFGLLVGGQRSLPRYSLTSRNLVLTTSLGIFSLFSLVLGLLVVFFRDFIIANTLLESSHELLIYLFAVNLFFSSFFFVSVNYFKSMGRIRIYNLLRQVIGPLLKLMIVLLTVLLVSSSALALWSSVVLAFGLASLTGILFLYRYSDYSIPSLDADRKDLLDFLDYSLFSTLNSAMVSVQFHVFFVFMAVFLKPVEAGVFGVSIAISALARWPLKSVNQIFPPIATKLYDQGRLSSINQLYRRTTVLILSLNLPITVLIAVYNLHILEVFSPEYARYALILPIVVMGQFTASTIGSVGLLLSMTDNQRVKSLMQFFLTLIILGITTFMTIEYGLLGLAIAYTASYILNNVAELFLLYLREGMQPFSLRHLKVFSLGAVMTLTIFRLFRIMPLKLSLTANFLVLLLYSVSVWRIFDEVDREVLRALLTDLN